MRRGRTDWDEEARKLFASLNLDASGAGNSSVYNNADVVWQHPSSGGKIFVGNHTIASNAAMLEEKGIFHVVNCTNSGSLPNYHESSDPRFTYLRFNISYWSDGGAEHHGGKRCNMQTTEGVLDYFSTLFQFVDDATAAGGSVLVHCLAGAHRAGTAGTALVMYKGALTLPEALKAAQALRHAINPFGHLMELLVLLDKAMAQHQHVVYGSSKTEAGPLDEAEIAAKAKLLHVK